MKLNLISLFTGILFGLGLILAGMASPSKVQGFLDIAGLWDPSLAFVMGGGIGVAVIFFAAAKKHSHTLITQETLKLPNNTTIDRRLIIGSAAFGIGWGIAGICPGPALVALGSGSVGALIFVIAMFAGMRGFEWLEHRR